ncbi:MAG: ABC transporter permease [Anaerolineae bacterium]|nr:ABC transporter permease [Anaerolineae bacterium]
MAELKLRQRLGALPVWFKLALLAALIVVVWAISKWLVLILLVVLGLWPIVLLAILAVLVPFWIPRLTFGSRWALAVVGLALLAGLVYAVWKTSVGLWPIFLLAVGGVLFLLFTKLRGMMVPFLAVLTALIIGALVLLFTDQALYQALGAGKIGEALEAGLGNVGQAYSALYVGALGDPLKILNGIGEWLGGAEMKALVTAVRGPSDSLVQSVPYIFAGLAVALGFRAGLFNIGAEGQVGVGWLASVVVGFAFPNLPTIILLPLAIVAGAAVAGLWAGIAGVLKARTGAHEVITTIMLNYVSYRLMAWLLCGPLEHTQGTCRTKDIAEGAFLPRFLPHPVTLHWGFFLALVAALVVGWYLFRTTWGFELRSVGANPSAARYGGMKVGRTFVVTMFLSGCLAGLAGVSQGLGITRNIALGFQSGYGFDSIALALLGKSHPAGVVAASILFGVLRAGASRMQSIAGVPTEIVQIVQAMVIIFIAAPAIIQTLYRLRQVKREEAEIVLSRGWGA